jgi:hypothetical protein
VLKWVLYPVFGLSVLGAYGASTTSGVDMTSVDTRRTTMPAEYRSAGAYRAAPIIWRTGFHGPAAYRPPTSYSSGSSGSSGYSGGGYYGGFGGK